MKRVLIKLSGEMLSHAEKSGIDAAEAEETAERLLRVQKEGFEVAVVIGGGNLLRGAPMEKLGVARTEADQMGMLATLMNGLALKSAIKKAGGKVKAFTALECPKVMETFRRDKAVEALEEGSIVIFVGGVGSPYFTTDTAAALRACEIKATLLAKATKVDGVYDSDPLLGKAKRFDTLTFEEFISQQLKVMDQTAVQLCKNEKIPIFVFNMKELGREPLQSLIKGQQGTLIQG